MQKTTPDPGTPIFGELNKELGELPEIDVHDFDAHGFKFPDGSFGASVDDTSVATASGTGSEQTSSTLSVTSPEPWDAAEQSAQSSQAQSSQAQSSQAQSSTAQSAPEEPSTGSSASTSASRSSQGKSSSAKPRQNKSSSAKSSSAKSRQSKSPQEGSAETESAQDSAQDSSPQDSSPSTNKFAVAKPESESAPSPGGRRRKED